MSFLSISSQSSAASGTCSNTSHWSTPAPFTPHLFADVNENPLPTTSVLDEAGSSEILADEHSATPTRKTVGAARASHIQDDSFSSSSSSMEAIDTPPSIHSYSSALRNVMRQRYDEAIARMKQDENKVVMDFSWEDEDPIDRHVKLQKAKAEWEIKRNAGASASTSSSSRPPIRPVSGETKTGLPQPSMLGRPTSASASLDEGLPPARPTLLDFRGFSHLTASSECATPDAGTPGSICSTGSFEAFSNEDWIDLYGRSRSSEVVNPRTLPMDSPSIINRMSQATISSEASGSTVRPTSFFEQGLSVTTQSPYTQPRPHGQAQSPTFQPLPTPAPMSAMSTGYFAIPTKSAPVATSRAYPERPSMGVRQQSRNHPYANANGRPEPRVDRTPDEADFTGRTESETMILRAGLRSQRSRAVTRV